MNKKVIVIGGGASGMIAAGRAAERGNSVLLLEKNDRLGKKLYITGKGRCNLTNDSPVETLIENTRSNPYFLYSAYYGFDSAATINFFESLGLKTKTERGGRVFPVSDKSGDVIDVLKDYCKGNGVKIIRGSYVKSVIAENGAVSGVVTETDNYYGDSVIIATGGMSYPSTGSSGDGYRFAERLGHTVTKPSPSLVPLKTLESWTGELQGLSLKNTAITLRGPSGKILFTDFGEMLFTHYGVSGPMILSASTFIKSDRLGETGEKYEVHPNNSNYSITIDLKPALSEKELDARILRDFGEYGNRDFKNSLNDLLPQRMIPVIIGLSGINPDKKTNSVTKTERYNLVKLLKNLKLNIIGTAGFDEAVITSGGVCVDEIDPSTLQSKIVKGLYFAGEVIDVDAFTGGFNLQIAFSTGWLAASKV